MRRFELVDGTSNKFWEIALEEASFTVRFGRIGTSGQVQQKTFGSAEEARAEHGRLVAEKLKKGYAEVASSGAAAPAPASDDAPIAWDDAFLRRVHPRRGGVQVPICELPTLSKAWSDVQELFAEIAQPVRDGSAHPRALKELTTAVIARIEAGTPSPASVKEDAALLSFLKHRASSTGHRNAEPALDLVYLLSGPAHSTRALLQSMAMRVAVDPENKSRDGTIPMVLVREPEQSWCSGSATGTHRGPFRLRELLAAVATDADYASAREAAAELQHANPQQLFARAYLFPTDRALFDEALNGKLGHRPDLRPLLTCATDASVLRALAQRLSLFALPRIGLDCLPTLLDGAGRDAVAFFDQLKAEVPTGHADERRAWAEPLARINSDEAMALLLDVADKRDVVPFVAEAIARWPRRAVRLLAARAAPRGAAGSLARALLVPLMRKDPGAVDAELPGLSPEAARAVESLRDDAAGGAIDAPPERLPAVLRRPPWRHGKPRELPVIEVKASAPPDEMAWRPGQREGWRKRRGRRLWSELSAADTEQYLRQHPDRAHACHFLVLPEPFALELIHAHTFGAEGEEEWLQALVARFEMKVLADILDAAGTLRTEALGALEPYASAEVAPRMAEASTRSRASRPYAHAWLLRYPAHAAAGLLAGALGPAGKEKKDACHALRLLAANGHRELVLDAARRATPPCQEAVREILDDDPLFHFPERIPKLPAWYEAAALPPLLLADRSGKVPAEGIDALVTMLAFPATDGWYAGIAEAKRALDPASVREVAWALFSLWLSNGAGNKESWAFQALGVLGDDEIARRLVPLIRQWPGEAAHARAVMGLDVLAAIGTDVTLSYLNGIAEKASFKGLRGKAHEKIATIAAARGLTQDELADRLVPTLGLDDDGSLQLDFGPRTFTVGFDEHLRPYVKDAEGARIKDLPRPNRSDDAEKAAAAEERWKALKQDARAAAGIQMRRMELSMCLRRHWPAATFKQFFVDHPLLVHVVRRLVWGTYDAKGALQATFRVAEDRTFADQADETFSLAGDAVVGIPHPLELPAGAAGAWGQVLGDYELVQPFPQLGRPTFTITEEERQASKLERVRGLTIHTGKVLGLEKSGWLRGPPQDGGIACWMEKRISGDRMLALDLDPGLYTGVLSESPEQTLGAVTLVREKDLTGEGELPFGEMDPILFSELVRDLEGLRG